MAKNGKSGWSKWLLILIVVILVAGLAAWYFGGKDDNDVQYVTTTITRGDLVQDVTATGTLNPVTNVTVGSQISGIIQTLYADWNTPVKAGQIVAQLDPATYQANVKQASGDLANAKANLELAQIQATRADELFTSTLISASDHDTAIASLHQAQAMVQIKEGALANSQVNLDRCTIYSPVDGTVISRNVDIGQTVAASLSAPTIFVIANDLAKMQIDANVSEADIGSVEEGMPVDFTVDAFSDRTFKGKVVQIRNSPTTVQNVVTYDAVVGVSNPDLKLRPGMTANASIITARRDGVLKIPNAALRFKPPEPGTNKSFLSRLFSGKAASDKPAVAAAGAPVVTSDGSTNAAAAKEAPLTGNEPPQELQRRVRAMRDSGVEIPAEIRAKLREYYQSGVLQRTDNANRAGGSVHINPQAESRNIYVLASGTATDNPVLKAVRIKLGISDGAFTEVVEGLNEGDVIVTSVKQTQAANAATATQNPFGGAGGGRGPGGGGGGGGRRF